MNKEILEITKRFHETYEKLSKEYSYETREDTKVFNVNSNNGKLMYATVNEIVSPILKENKQLKDNWNKLKEWLEEQKDNRKYANDVERFTAYGATLDKIQEIEGGING